MKVPFKFAYDLTLSVRMLVKAFRGSFSSMEIPEVVIPRHRRRRMEVRKMQTHPKRSLNFRQLQGENYSQQRAV